MLQAGRVVGGNFGHIEAGAAEVVSLIWPTIVRVVKFIYLYILLSN